MHYCLICNDLSTAVTNIRNLTSILIRAAAKQCSNKLSAIVEIDEEPIQQSPIKY